MARPKKKRRVSTEPLCGNPVHPPNCPTCATQRARRYRQRHARLRADGVAPARVISDDGRTIRLRAAQLSRLVRSGTIAKTVCEGCENTASRAWFAAIDDPPTAVHWFCNACRKFARVYAVADVSETLPRIPIPRARAQSRRARCRGRAAHPRPIGGGPCPRCAAEREQRYRQSHRGTIRRYDRKRKRERSTVERVEAYVRGRLVRAIQDGLIKAPTLCEGAECTRAGRIVYDPQGEPRVPFSIHSWRWLCPACEFKLSDGAAAPEAAHVLPPADVAAAASAGVADRAQRRKAIYDDIDRLPQPLRRRVQEELDRVTARASIPINPTSVMGRDIAIRTFDRICAEEEVLGEGSRDA